MAENKEIAKYIQLRKDGYITESEMNTLISNYKNYLAKKREALANKGKSKNSKKMGDLVKVWYTTQYPTDEVGSKLNNSLTFSDAIKALKKHGGKMFYMFLGSGDSVIRERVFEELASRTGKDYDYFYDLWVNGGEKKTPRTRSMKLPSNSMLNKRAFK